MKQPAAIVDERSAGIHCAVGWAMTVLTLMAVCVQGTIWWFAFDWADVHDTPFPLGQLGWIAAAVACVAGAVALWAYQALLIGPLLLEALIG